MTQLQLFPMCQGYPVRKERPTTFEYVAAELWVRELYRKYFRVNGGEPQIITWQYERFYTQYETADDVLDITMSLLESDFRNVFTDAVRRKWDSLIKKNAPEATLLELLRQAAPGGSRKPDMLGIHAGATLLFDSVEVGTDKTAESTFKELTDKMAIIDQEVVPQIKLRLPALQRRYASRGMTTSIPSDFVVRASPFRLEPWAKVLPLPIVAGDEGVREVDWICYHPTDTWAPASASGSSSASSSGGLGTDGIILYHIHRASLPRLPQEVRSRMRKELDRLEAERSGLLELNPALLGAFVRNKSEW